MADQLAFLPERVFTAAAMPGAGYRVQFYQSDTTTPVTVYTTSALSVAHPSPLTCDATGVFPTVFSAGGAIKAVVTKPDGSTFYTLDPVFRVSTSASGAAEITFSPTGALPFTNVQAAIEGAAATAASGFTPFGLGVTGTNTLLANLDATGTGAGAYRFDNTTTGTFPSSVVAADTGTVQLWRENSGDAVMWLQSGAADRSFFRRMAGSVWGAWREVITVDQGAAEGDTIYRALSAWTRLAKGAAGQALKMNSGATAPEWSSSDAIPVKFSFNTRSQPTGTYSQSGTLITVTQTGHGMTTGQGVRLDFTTGTAVDGYFIITVTGANTYTVTAATSLTTSGSVTRLLWARTTKGVANVTLSGFEVTLVFATPFADVNYLFFATGSTDNTARIPLLSMYETSPPSTTQITFVQRWEQGSGGGGDNMAWASIMCMGGA